MILYLLYSTGPTRKQPHHSTMHSSEPWKTGGPASRKKKLSSEVRSSWKAFPEPNKNGKYVDSLFWRNFSPEDLAVATTLYSNLPWSSLTLLFIMVKPTQFKSIAILIFQPINPEPFHRCDGCVAFGHINLAWVPRTKSALGGGRAKKIHEGNKMINSYHSVDEWHRFAVVLQHHQIPATATAPHRERQRIPARFDDITFCKRGPNQEGRFSGAVGYEAIGEGWWRPAGKAHKFHPTEHHTPTYLPTYLHSVVWSAFDVYVPTRQGDLGFW